MRARWIILIILLYGWAILVGPPQSWAPYVHTVFGQGHFLRFLGVLIITVFTFPGRWILSLVWPGFFDLTLVQFWHGASFGAVAIAVFAWTFTILFSYVFWVTFLSRFWKFIGRWNPFGAKAERARPHVLKMMADISDWWESETSFGQHATGGFAGLVEVLSNEFQFGDIFLGRPKLMWGGMLRPIGIPTERHMVTIAGTGSGKTTGALIPNLCLHGGSALVIDPKGELARITARSRGNGGGGVRGIGQKVFVLDPFRIVEGFESASYNVFDEMERVAQYDAERPVSYARKISEALVRNVSKDPYWDEAPRTFITGLILHIFQGPKEKRNLIHLRELLMEGDVETYKKVSKPGEHGDAFDALLVMMKNSPEGPYRHVIVGSANALSTMPHNMRGSVMAMAMEHTVFLDMPEIRRISMKSDFLLEDLQNSRISVYLCLPLNAVSGIEGRWLRMFVMLTVDMFSRINRVPDPPLLLAIDEFPSLGKLDGIEAVAPTMRSKGVRLWVIGQDIEQFEKVYPDSWGGFIGNAEAVQFMGTTHPPTVAWIAERLGQHVVVERKQMGKGQVREDAKERPLRDPEQIARMLSKEKKNQIIWRGSKRPMLLKVCPYYEYMPWWYYSRDNDHLPEKWNRRIWRRRSDPDITPHIPLSNPPRYIPPSGPPKPPDEEIHSYPPEISEYLPKQPPDLKPSDNVPGTDRTWAEAVTNFLHRMKEEGERQKKAAGENWLPPELQKFSTIRNETPPPVPPDKGPALPSFVPPQPDIRPADLKGGDGAANAAMVELDGMIGLQKVKDEIRQTVDLLELGRERARTKLPDMNPAGHLVFTGNPGTGKTTVARIVGRIYKEIGLLKSGHMVEVGRGDLIGEYIGHTAPKTKEVIARAMDGVLFIDEAYTLKPTGRPNDFEAEAVATLLTAMEDNRDRLVVIAAGYKDEMEAFIDSNPGLKSRFETFIEFEDYSPRELMDIFVYIAREKGMRLSLDAQIAVSKLMESLETGEKGFGNGRTVRNIMKACFARQAKRLREKGRGNFDVTVFEASDIPQVGEQKFS